MFNFEKLDVWHKGLAFADSIYTLTRKFPADERFGLTHQMRRAAISTPSNVAEGSSRASQTNFGRFIEIGTGSLYEVVTQSFIAKKLGFLSAEEFGRVYRDAEELSRMLSGLRRSLS